MKAYIFYTALVTTLFIGRGYAGAAEWHHNDPNNVTSEKVQGWDGSSSVTLDTGSTVAVAMVNGTGTPLGKLVKSKLSLSEFVKANDLEASQWRDVTWRSGSETLSIVGTDLSEKTGVTSFAKIMAPGAPRVDKHYEEGVYHAPSGANLSFSYVTGVRVDSKIVVIQGGGVNQRGDREETHYTCYYITAKASRSGEKVIVSRENQRYGRTSKSRCGTPKPLSLTLTIASPSPKAPPVVNYFLKVND